MDYSIFICVFEPFSYTTLNDRFIFHGANYSYSIGIIDYLQKYTWKKRAERYGKMMKAVFTRNSISSINSKKYA